MPVSGGKIMRYFNVRNAASVLATSLDFKDSLIVCDTINPLCVSVATMLGKRYKKPVIGVCTDSPSNITGTTRSYTLMLLKKAKKCDGFIALTTGLDSLFNENGKPSMIMEGVVENESVEPKRLERGYIFFGGALLKRYGVYELISAFKMLNREDIDLYVAGHSEDDNKILEAIGDTQNIKYLSTIPVSEVLSYEAGALININPRPYNEDLDRFSIPSKTIEYLQSGQIVISVRNTKLEKYFEEEVYWAKSGSAIDLCEAMRYVLSLSENERKAYALKAKEKVQSLFSLDQISKKLDEFFTNFSRN